MPGRAPAETDPRLHPMRGPAATAAFGVDENRALRGLRPGGTCRSELYEQAPSKGRGGPVRSGVDAPSPSPQFLRGSCVAGKSEFFF